MGLCPDTDMGATEPTAKNLADLYQLGTLDWSDVRGRLETKLTQAPGTGGPDHHTFWLSTIDADGKPHLTAVGAYWVDGRYYFSGGERSRKIRNIERDPRCAIGVAIRGYDVALEGQAVRVADGGFTHEFSAPSAGPPPWFVYEFTPRDAYAVMTEEPGGATRWTF